MNMAQGSGRMAQGDLRNVFEPYALSLVPYALYIRLIPRDFGSLASEHFQTASVKNSCRTISLIHFILF
jgi:hypothetical protein